MRSQLFNWLRALEWPLMWKATHDVSAAMLMGRIATLEQRLRGVENALVAEKAKR